MFKILIIINFEIHHKDESVHKDVNHSYAIILKKEDPDEEQL